MNVFISGGCKNGKSMYAQRIAKRMSQEEGVPLYYLATMIPTDDEDRERITRHIGDREGWGFETIEQGIQIEKALDGEVDAGGARASMPGMMDTILNLGLNDEAVEGFAKKTGNTVFVSDYIYSDSRVFDHYTESYRKALALIDRTLAKTCDKVIEVAFGHIYEYDNEDIIK